MTTSLRASDPRNPFSVRIGSPEKLSASRRKLGEDAGSWAIEAYDILLQEYPWMAKVTVKAVLDRVQEGSGVGYFHLTPFQAPITALAAGELASLTIPIIVQGGQLAPFQVFAREDKFYPITEERILRLLRMKNTVMQVDRRDFRVMEPSRYALDRLHSNTGGPRGTEFYSKTASSLLQQVVTFPKLSAAPSMELDASVLSEAAFALARQFKRSAAGFEVRTYWGSAPQDGTTKLSAWEPLNIRDLTLEIGADNLAKLSEIEALHTRPMGTTEVVVDGGVEKLSYGNSGGMSGGPMPACPQPIPTASVSCTLYREDGASKTSVPVFAFTHPGQAQSASEWGTRWLCPSTGVVHEYDLDAWGTGPKMAVLVDEVAAPVAGLAGVRAFAEKSNDASAPCAFLVIDRSVDFGHSRIEWVRVVPTPFQTPDGAVYRGTESTAVYRVDPTVRKCLAGRVAGADVIHLPAGAVTLVAHTSDCADNTWMFPQAAPSETSYADPGAMEAPADPMVRVSHVSGRFSVRGVAPTPGLLMDDLHEPEARLALAAQGLRPYAVDALLKMSQETGAAEAAVRRHTLPLYGIGQQAKEATRRVLLAKLSAVPEGLLEDVRIQARTYARHMQTVLRHPEDFQKLSAASAETSVDAALSLGSLTRESLYSYCAMLPDLETSLSQVCALLVASQLGLEEVDESACTSAIRSLDAVVRGLKVVEHSLSVQAS